MIVTSTASMTTHAQLGDGPESIALSRRVQTAMSNAVQRAQAAGVTDPDAIRHAQIVARDKVLAG